MAIFELITKYIFQARFEMSLSFLLLMAQAYLQTVSPCVTFYSSIRRNSIWERLLLSIAPGMFTLVWLVMDAFYGATILSVGLDEISEQAMLTYMEASNFSAEVWALLLLLPLTTLLVYRFGSTNNLPHIWRWICGVSEIITWLWYLFGLTLTVYGVWNGFCQGFMGRLYVYGIYCIAFRFLLNMIAIVYHLLFSEYFPKKKLNTLCDNPAWCRRQIKRLLTSGQRVVFFAILPIAAFFYWLLWLGFHDAASDFYDVFMMLHLILLPMDIIMLRSVYRIVRPNTIPAMKTMMQWGHREWEEKCFCREYFSKERPFWEGKGVTVTRSFLAVQGNGGMHIVRLKELTYVHSFVRKEQRYLELSFPDATWIIPCDDEEMALFLKNIYACNGAYSEEAVEPETEQQGREPKIKVKRLFLVLLFIFIFWMWNIFFVMPSLNNAPTKENGYSDEKEKYREGIPKAYEVPKESTAGKGKYDYYYDDYYVYYLKHDAAALPDSLLPNTEREIADYIISYMIYSEDIFCMYGRKNLSGEDTEEQFGYADSIGRLLADTEYDFAYPFSEGLGCVVKEGRYGFLDKRGEVVIPFQYLDAAPFSEGLAYFCTEENYGFMDKAGKPVFLLDCDSVSSFSEGLAYFSIDGKYGFLDKRGEVVIEAVYDDADYFEDGLAAVRKNGFVGMIDSNGREIVPAEYVHVFRGKGSLRCQLENGNYEYYRFSGEKITKEEYKKYLVEDEDEIALSWSEARRALQASRLLLTNKITPEKELYWRLSVGRPVNVWSEDGEKWTEEVEYLEEGLHYRKVFKLFSVNGMEEAVLYRKEEPFHLDTNFPLSDSALYGILDDNSLSILLKAHESGGSARGDRVCFWYDKETDEALSGIAGAAGGFMGFSNWKTIYETSGNEFHMRESICWTGQASSNYTEEELLENAENFFDEEDRPFTKETILESEAVNEYEVNGQKVTPEMYMDYYDRYIEIEVLN